MPGTLVILKDMRHSKDPPQPSRTSWPGDDPAGTATILSSSTTFPRPTLLAAVFDVHGLDAAELAARDNSF